MEPNRRSNDNVSIGNSVALLIVIAVFVVGFAGKPEQARQDRESVEIARTVGMVAHNIQRSCGL